MIRGLLPMAVACRFAGRAAAPLLAAVLGFGLWLPSAPALLADERVSAMLERLDDRQRREFQEWRAAQQRLEAELAAYWKKVESTRSERRGKLRGGRQAGPDDYVMTFPPEYTGPGLAPEIARLWEQLKPPADPKPIPTVADMLDSAKAVYGFVPERIPEREFKRRYALEALAHGISKEQVVRVYALETGGMGTHDMQSGINPVTKRGTPISTALGYAQLLHANSVSELVRHGATFIARLEAAAETPGLAPQRAADLQKKAGVLRKMLANARKGPDDWYAHMRFAATRNGLGIHALNLDGDIGPMLQVIKLKGVREVAEKAGRATLTPAELELMNLAGPSTGLEMMTPLGRDAPTPNFFSRGGYQRNPVVHKRSGAELLAALDARMDVHVRKAGAVEFATVFDEVMSARASRR
ncbi:MAG: hypothetical protein KJZ80_13180 [Hyphomicrobiaceae bacterium]|nr:hypothetical protein [Hyphomicrobiaceae bacterium]